MDKNFWQLGAWRGVPVALHWTVLFVFVWLYFFFRDFLATVIASVAFFVLLVVHELGHAAMLRWKKIEVERITFFGLHGSTEYSWASAANEILIAWGGVAAQLSLLLIALAVSFVPGISSTPIIATIAVPVLFVFIQVNIFMMVVALLPIGPFDGRRAWAVIPRTRDRMRQRRKAANARKVDPEKGLSKAKRRELEDASAKEAAELIEKLSRNTRSRNEDA
jgi:stage IV sporulation protein FB